ncbi:glycoside hydrolase family 6 protein [soil metagenome]
MSRKQIIALSVSGGVAFVVVVGFVFSLILGGNGVNPFIGKTLYLYPGSSAAVAASTASGAQKVAFDKIANTPTAIWLTPEQHDTQHVTSFVDGIVSAAADADQLPVFVVYGIPNRDCSGQSGGGTTAADYPTWVAAIAAGLQKRTSIVVLEPDSLALTDQCGNADERVAEIAQAAGILSSSSTSVYLDGGHSTFLSAEKQADLLNRAGVSKVRGFASNVSNFNTTDAEIAYDSKVSSLTGGAHFVIDVGRNGNGSNGDWCNPSGRRLGDPPAVIDDGTAHDANLWIKNPGESDGSCNGGPAAGVWWPDGALALAAN